MELRTIWDTGLAAINAFAPAYQDGMRAVMDEEGIQEVWFPLYLARGLYPEPITREIYAQLVGVSKVMDTQSL